MIYATLVIHYVAERAPEYVPYILYYFFLHILVIWLGNAPKNSFHMEICIIPILASPWRGIYWLTKDIRMYIHLGYTILGIILHWAYCLIVKTCNSYSIGKLHSNLIVHRGNLSLQLINNGQFKSFPNLQKEIVRNDSKYAVPQVKERSNVFC